MSLCPHLPRGAERQQLAGILYDDTVAVLSLFHEMSCDNDSCTNFRECGNTPPEFAAPLRIGAAGRFVEEQDLRFVQQRHGHREALLEAAGQLPAGRHFLALEVELPHDDADTFT